MSTRSLTLIVALALTTFAATETAEARPRPAGKHKKSNFEANKTFGLGLMFGTPTGLSGKYFVGPSTAIDFGIGGIGCCRGRRGVNLHADFLWHPLSFVSDPAFELPLYFGIGGRFFSYDWRHGDHDHGGSSVGVRAPIGIAFDFNNVPLDIFLELALVAEFLFDDDDDFDDNFEYDDDGLYIDLDGAIGIRYWFM